MSSQDKSQDLADLLSESSPITDRTIEEDISEISKIVIETLGNVKGAELIKEVNEKEADLKGKFIDNSEANTDEKFLEVFTTLVELFSEKEDEEAGGSMNELLGFGKDPKEEAVETAMKYSDTVTKRAVQISQQEKKQIKKQIEEYREDKKELEKKLESGKKDKNLIEFIESLKERLE